MMCMDALSAPPARSSSLVDPLSCCCAAAVPRTTPRTIDTAITDVIHDELEDVEHFVYTNESPHMYLGLPLPSGIDVISFDGYGKETPLFAPYMYKMHHFTKTGSGQT
jgi:hypothetical protein